MSNKQWKQGGECSKCLRQKYCNKKRVNKLISNKVAEFFVKGGAV